MHIIEYEKDGRILYRRANLVEILFFKIFLKNWKRSLLIIGLVALNIAVEVLVCR